MGMGNQNKNSDDVNVGRYQQSVVVAMFYPNLKTIYINIWKVDYQ